MTPADAVRDHRRRTTIRLVEGPCRRRRAAARTLCGARTLLVAPVLAAACASSPAVPPPPYAPPATTVAAATPAVPTDDGAGRAVTAALAAVTRERMASDLAELARPRHHLTAPAGLEAAARHVSRELAAAGYAVGRAPVTHRAFRADNVVGELAGSDGERVLLVGAHYDAVRGTPGADDNASGVAGALAVARAMALAEPRATIRVVAFAFEEQGLVGSAVYANALPKEERARIAAVVNLDMIGFRDRRAGAQADPLDRLRPAAERRRPAADFIAVWANPDARTILDALDAARSFVPDLAVETLVASESMLPSAPDLMRSDHASFWTVGVPAVSIVDTADMRSPHYHRPSDTVATLDLDFAVDVSRWVATALVLLDRGVGKTDRSGP